MNPLLMMMLLQSGAAAASGLSQGGLTGQPGRFEQINLLNPQQRQLQESLGQAVSPGLNYYKGILGGDTSQLQALSDPIMRQFEQQIAPGIAGRFASRNSLRSSAFQNALGTAATNLGSNIGQLQANLLGQAAGNLTGLSGQALQPNFQNIYRPQVPGALDALAQSFGGMGQGVAQGYGAQSAKSIYGV
ncbi:MAG: hypothetical protein PVF17_00660 [Ignavibacteria bacterium]|jgi:hypothetical protein